MGRIAGPRLALTGAGGPMGRAAAHRLIADGARKLALTDISGTRLDETVTELNASYPDLHILSLRADVTVAEEAKAFSDMANDGFDGIDVLVNMVGGIRSPRLYTAFLEMDEAQFRATFDLNLMGGFHLIKAFAPKMLKTKAGRIINIASIVFGGEAGQADYAAAKAAVASMTRSLAAEFAPAITVNAVAPGLTRTSVTKNIPADEAARLTSLAFDKRMAEPEEIAEGIAFFASANAGFVTGEIMAVSGGVRPHL